MHLDAIVTKLERLADLVAAAGVSERLQPLADDVYSYLAETLSEVALDVRPLTPAEIEKAEREHGHSWKGGQAWSPKEKQTAIEREVQYLIQRAMNDLRDVREIDDAEAFSSRLRRITAELRKRAHGSKLPDATQSAEFVKWAASTGLNNLAIVFTDIIDSTRLNNELGDAEWDRIRSAHFARAQQTVAEHNGWLIKTVGDAVMVAFRNSVDALRFALKIESDTGHELVRIRAGVHVGQVQVKEGDTFGAEVNLAARISSKPESGGIWVSERVREDWLSHDPRQSLQWTRHDNVEPKGFQEHTFILWSLPPSGSPAPTPAPQSISHSGLHIPQSKIASSRLFRGRNQSPESLVGRDKELADLDAAWFGRADLPVSPDSKVASQRYPTKTNIITIVAWGGIGKTSLVAHWASRLLARSADLRSGATLQTAGPESSAPSLNAQPATLKSDPPDLYFDWSFYSQGTRRESGAAGASHAASADLFLKEALEFFGDPALAASNASAWQKGERLAQLIGQQRTLLILDGLEPLQDARIGELRDDGLRALLRGLAGRNHGLCLLTTRQHLPDLNTWRQTTAPDWQLARLTDEAGAALLTKLGVNGTDPDKRELSAEVKGHALTLTLLGNYLRKAHHGDIRRVDRVNFQTADDHVQGGHAFRVIAAYECWFEESDSFTPIGGEGRREREHRLGKTCLAILRMLGLFDRPATPDCLAALRDPPIPGLTDTIASLNEEEWNRAVNHLVELSLVEDQTGE